MAAPHDQLHATIEKLHSELAGADIDAATADDLRSAVEDIQAALSRCAEKPNEGPGDEGAEPTPERVDRLSETARAFEESHPILSRTISQIVDILGQMGI